MQSITIIIPTYNRSESLRRLLDSLSKQSLPPTISFDVIAIDDGSLESYDWLNEYSWPFSFTIIRQENQGEAIARNLGAMKSNAEFLLFLDDDMQIESTYILEMYAEHILYPDAILIGNMKLLSNSNLSIFNQIMASSTPPHNSGDVPFIAILAGVLGISRGIFNTLGGMHPFPDRKRGGWIDMQFAYRAHLQGYSFRICEKAIAYHDDYVFESLERNCNRCYKVSELAIELFKEYPGLFIHIPMFQDKAPIFWGKDLLVLMLKKVCRPILAWSPLLSGMMRLTRYSEKYFPNSCLLRKLYIWIVGSYIYLGFRSGLKQVDLKTFWFNTQEKTDSS